MSMLRSLLLPGVWQTFFIITNWQLLEATWDYTTVEPKFRKRFFPADNPVKIDYISQAAGTLSTRPPAYVGENVTVMCRVPTNFIGISLIIDWIICAKKLNMCLKSSAKSLSNNGTDNCYAIDHRDIPNTCKQYAHGNYSIKIPNVTFENAGSYTCLVQTYVGCYGEIADYCYGNGSINVEVYSRRPPSSTPLSKLVTEQPETTVTVRPPFSSLSSKLVTEQPETIVSVTFVVCLSALSILVVSGLMLVLCYRCRSSDRKQSSEKRIIHRRKFRSNPACAKRNRYSPSVNDLDTWNNLIDKSDIWEINRERLQLTSWLGIGEFGRVCLARLLPLYPCSSNITVQVAVKTTLEGASFDDYVALKAEIDLMKSLGVESHPNVISMLGCCLSERPFYLVLEYAAKGNLRDLLRKLTKSVDINDGYLVSSSTKTFEFSDLLNFGLQIAKGMEYLELKKTVHRDLATRNILVTENDVVKIADFGMSRQLYNKNYYRKVNRGWLPIKWMAPEALMHNIYTSQSDVSRFILRWSFGVVLWEIMTLGDTPFSTVSTLDQLQKILLMGQRLPQPDLCSPMLYNMMLSCWQLEANHRPTFLKLISILQAMLDTEFQYQKPRPEMSLDHTAEVFRQFVTLEDPYEAARYRIKQLQMEPFQKMVYVGNEAVQLEPDVPTPQKPSTHHFLAEAKKCFVMVRFDITAQQVPKKVKPKVELSKPPPRTKTKSPLMERERTVFDTYWKWDAYRNELKREKAKRCDDENTAVPSCLRWSQENVLKWLKKIGMITYATFVKEIRKLTGLGPELLPNTRDTHLMPMEDINGYLAFKSVRGGKAEVTSFRQYQREFASVIWDYPERTLRYPGMIIQQKFGKRINTRLQF